MGEKFSIEDINEFDKKIEQLLYLKREDFGSIEHRKEIADFFKLDKQEVMDLPKREFKTLVIGMNRGKTCGTYITTEVIKTSYFCVDMDIWNHKKAEFEKILEDAINEMKEANNAETDEEGNDDVSEESRENAETVYEDSEELE